MSGYSEFRVRMKGYKNKEYIGVTQGELISIEPVTIRVMYGEKPFTFKKFMSLISFDNVKEEDIGNKYILQFESNNQGILILGSVRYYEEFYPDKGEGE